MLPDDVLETGQYRFRFHASPHIPHGWDAGVLFETTQKSLFCSDLFHHFGDADAVTGSDLIGPTRQAMQQMQHGPLAGYMPYTRHTAGVLYTLADVQPQTLAVMHGSSFTGHAGGMLRDLACALQETFDAEPV
jgi:hypothetical protein